MIFRTFFMYCIVYYIYTFSRFKSRPKKVCSVLHVYFSLLPVVVGKNYLLPTISHFRLYLRHLASCEHRGFNILILIMGFNCPGKLHHIIQGDRFRRKPFIDVSICIDEFIQIPHSSKLIFSRCNTSKRFYLDVFQSLFDLALPF